MSDTIKKAIGKNTLGDTNKMNVDLKTYNRSTHDLSYVWRNTQSPGTLVPCMKFVSTPGDGWEIEIDADVMTHPTIGPLFGSFKLQVDIFSVPFRLYNSWLHNNRLGIGMNMGQIKLPQIKALINGLQDKPTEANEFPQCNPSSILSYLGIKGYGVGKDWKTTPSTGYYERKNAIPFLGYWDIVKNYYVNKQETKGYFIGGGVNMRKLTIQRGSTTIYTGSNFNSINTPIGKDDILTIEPAIEPKGLIFSIWTGETAQRLTANEISSSITVSTTSTIIVLNKGIFATNILRLLYWIQNDDDTKLTSYDIANIDTMRDKILSTPGNMEFVIDQNLELPPYGDIVKRTRSGRLATYDKQFGLALKTYQSDIYQNWINTEWIDGAGGINELTAIDTSSGSFTIDTLNLSKKLYIMMNRIAISGGSYQDYIETVWTAKYDQRAETPIYEGGISQEIVFQEVISNSASEQEPLGTLAGRGVLSHRKKGGRIKISTNEPSYIMGICSITPRIDYNQGNDFDTLFKSMNDLHKPALDGIGFQDLVTDGMAWWDTKLEAAGFENSKRLFTAVGKQPAWLNYMTNVNRTYGNFADKNNEGFMVLNRNYELDETDYSIGDLTTYIDPKKYNYIFADASLDAMNFWVQLGITTKPRRKMSAKIIPNL